MIAAAVAPQVEVQNLEVFRQRRQGGLHRQATAATIALARLGRAE